MSIFFASGSFARSAALSSLSYRVERISAAMMSTAKSLLRKNPVMRYHALVAPVSIAKRWRRPDWPVNANNPRYGLNTCGCPRPPVTAVKRSRKEDEPRPDCVPVGGALTGQALATLALDGVLTSLGYSAGRKTTIDALHAQERECPRGHQPYTIHHRRSQTQWPLDRPRRESPPMVRAPQYGREASSNLLGLPAAIFTRQRIRAVQSCPLRACLVKFLFSPE